MTNVTETNQALHRLFHPRAVAVIGASDDTTKHGYIVLTNVRASGFAGGVYGISRRLHHIEGIPCYPDIAAAPKPIDVAFLAIPAEAAVHAVRDCARAGLSAVIIGSAGYAESLDPAGAQRQAELARIATEEGVRIIGPNCNGIYNAHLPLAIGFNTAHAKRLASGGISIFSHSGALFDAMAGRLQMLGAGLALFASAGNEADFSVLDYMEYSIGHVPTRVIALLIDSISDGPRFRRLALAAHEAGKPVVALKIGASEAGAQAAVAHSSRLAGDAAAYTALMQASGVAITHTLEGFMAACALLDRHGRRAGDLGALSTSGAGASLIADRCAAIGVRLAQMTPETFREINARRMFSRIGNPLDLGIFGGMRRAGEVPGFLAADANVGATFALLHSMNPWQGDPIRAALSAARENTGKPLLVVAPGGLTDIEHAFYVQHGMDVFGETDIALEAVGALLAPPPEPIPTRAVANNADTPRRVLSEPESLQYLAAFGVPAVPTTECTTLNEALAAAENVGWPVVLKAVVENVAHKSDLGLVRVGLRDSAALRAAFESLGAPRVIVQPMITGDLEAIAGVARSPGVGLVLIAGLGGLFAEALRETVTWPIPVTREVIARGLAESALGRVMQSPRWKHPYALSAFIGLLLQLQDAALAAGDRLQAIDVNPVILGALGAIAVDALVIGQ